MIQDRRKIEKNMAARDRATIHILSCYISLLSYIISTMRIIVKISFLNQRIFFLKWTLFSLGTYRQFKKDEDLL